MVVIDWPFTALTGTMQLRVKRPSMSTVQAPHIPMPQPNLVPVSASSSRNTHRSGVSASTSTLRSVPLTLRVTMSGSHHLEGELMLRERQRAQALASCRVDCISERGRNGSGARLTDAAGRGRARHDIGLDGRHVVDHQ